MPLQLSADKASPLEGGDNDSLRGGGGPCEVMGQTSVLLILTDPHAAERSSNDSQTQRAALAVIHCVY